MKTQKDRFSQLFLAFFIIGLFGLIALFFVFDPESGVFWQYLVVYALLSFVVFTGFTFFGHKIRLIRSRTGANYANKKDSLRQGLFFSIFTVAMLAMQAYGVLSWWIALILVAVIVVAELYFISRR